MTVSYPSHARPFLHPAVHALLVVIVAGVLALSAVSAPAAPLQKMSEAIPFPKYTSSVSLAESSADNEIEATIARLQARASELRTHPLPEKIELISDVPNGATPDEYREWRRLTGSIVDLLDGRIESLRALQDIRKSVRDLEIQSTGWRGFSEKPPYPLSLMDSLQDKIKARKIGLHSNELQRPICEGELAGYTSSLRESRTQQRLAEERLEQGRGKPGETRLRWLLALATRRNDLNETGVVTLESWRQTIQEGLSWYRQDIAFLERQFSHAAANFRFTRQELDKKLHELDAHGELLNRELEHAVKAEKHERAKQQQVRDSLRRSMAMTRADDASPRLEALKQALEVQQARVMTANLRTNVCKALSQLTQVERRVWQARYQIANPGTGVEPPDIKQIQKDLEEVRKAKEGIRSPLDEVENSIRSQETRISSPDLPVEERESARTLLDTYKESRALFFRVDEQLSASEQLLQRFTAEFSARTGRGSVLAATMGELLDKVLTFADKIWNTDLYIAEETVVVEGQKIVRARSVTVGKVITAFLIFFIGIVAARMAMGPVRRLAARKFRLNENNSQVVSRLTFYLLFVCILVLSLVTVNIPLAVFAFFGGALAIGVGFGAQTLINNFISGLILLFDRTIRLNDFVEVDGQRGRVTAINIRSSRIRRSDGIEMLIPNSHFLQQKVVNLTLSDPHTRYEIPVGVACGTSPRTAEAVILRAVVEQPEVLTEPPPFVVFEDFADSSLNFRALFWLNLNSDINTMIVLSEVRHRIADYLAQAGIGIPFPRRDLHLDASQPLAVTIRREGPQPGP